MDFKLGSRVQTEDGRTGKLVGLKLDAANVEVAVIALDGDEVVPGSGPELIEVPAGTLGAPEDEWLAVQVSGGFGFSVDNRKAAVAFAREVNVVLDRLYAKHAGMDGAAFQGSGLECLNLVSMINSEVTNELVDFLGSNPEAQG